MGRENESGNYKIDFVAFNLLDGAVSQNDRIFTFIMVLFLQIRLQILSEIYEILHTNSLFHFNGSNLPGTKNLDKPIRWRN